MKKIVIMSLLATILMGQGVDVNSTQSSEIEVVKNPKVYAALGDIIYNNIDNIVKLKEIDTFKNFSEKINNYSSSVQKAKEIGSNIESGNKNVSKSLYLETLRTLSKENDYFVRSVKSAYTTSIAKQDSKLFIETVNSGLVDTDKNREQIIEYYLSHSEDINASGVIQKYLDQDAKTESKRKSYSYEKSKKLRLEAKIRRIREDDQKKQAKLEKELTNEVKQKKIEIRENQKRELFN